MPSGSVIPDELHQFTADQDDDAIIFFASHAPPKPLLDSLRRPNSRDVACCTTVFLIAVGETFRVWHRIKHENPTHIVRQINPVVAVYEHQWRIELTLPESFNGKAN